MPVANLDRITSRRAFEVGAIDAKRGTFANVALITSGVEALGHGSFIDEGTVRGLSALLVGKSLPAYIGHEGGGLFGDGERLTSEVGIWSGIHLAGGKLRAKQFQFLRSFEEHEPAKRDRLVELAEKMPDQFGVSLVGRVSLAWATPTGDEPFFNLSSRPEEALYEYPSVRFSEVESADFVKQPAANPDGLFSANPPAVVPPVDAAVDAPAVGMSAPAPEVTPTADVTLSADPLVEHLKADFQKQLDAFAAEKETFAAQLAAIWSERDALKAEVDATKLHLAKVEADAAATVLKFQADTAQLNEELSLARDNSAARLGVPAIGATEADVVASESVTVANFWSKYDALPNEAAKRKFYRDHLSIARKA